MTTAECRTGGVVSDDDLSATLSIGGASSRDWDAIVIGAGPAGALSAVLLARRGLATLLIDARQFPRYKVCGACLNPRSVAVLKSVGLHHVLANAAPLDRFHIGVAGRHVALPLPGSVVLSRDQFDAELVSAAIDAGAEFLPGCRARVLRHAVDCPSAAPHSADVPSEAESGGRSEIDRQTAGAAARVTALSTNDRFRDVQLQAGSESQTVRGAVVLACDGLSHSSLSELDGFNSRVSSKSRIGVGSVLPESDGFDSGTIHMAVGSGGYVGLVQLEDRRLNLAAALDPVLVRKSNGISAALQRILESAGFPELAGLGEAEIHGTPALTRHTQPLAAHRLILLGDAAGYVEPFTGEGIAWALALAQHTPAIVTAAGRYWDTSVEQCWRHIWQDEVGRHQFWCRRLAALMRRPALLRWLAAVLSRYPQLAEPVVRKLNRVPVSMTDSWASELNPAVGNAEVADGGPR